MRATLIEKGSLMSVFLRRTSGAAIVYAIAAQGALADLTAGQVWADWQAYMGGMGYEVSGSESTAGDVTTISDMTMSLALPEDEGSVVMTVPEMTLTETGDGSVAITFPESFPMTIDFSAAGEGDGQAVLTYTQQGLEMLVSGSPEDMTYDYKAAGLGLALTSLIADGETIPADALKAGFTMQDVSGQSRMQIGEMRTIAQTMSAAGLSYEIAFDDPESDESASFAGTLGDLGFEGSGTLPLEIDASDYEALMANGFAFAGGFTFGQGNTNVAGNAEGENFAFTSASQGGTFKVAIDDARLGYDVTQNGTQISVTTQELPFPVEMAMDGAGFTLDVPVQQGDEPQPFTFGMNLTGFTMSDILWSMFDPAGALPRDPATVVLNTDGTAKVLVNVMDPAVSETLAATGAAPGELHSLNINELLISMVGAKLSGTGAFEFDNSNLSEFDGMPAPSGTANLELTGANALIDKLIGMGMMSDSDAMGARMMMGMLAVPGDAPDSLKSKIEITKDGQISANGQRIK